MGETQNIIYSGEDMLAILILCGCVHANTQANTELEIMSKIREAQDKEN